jgi:ABC-type Fe3+-siderophore transport system permease subunit
VAVSDVLARTLFPGEIPLGILTALAGSIIFLALLTRETLKVRS